MNKKVSIVIPTKNEGDVLANCLNLKCAKGEFIAFTDADCVADRNWLKNLIKYFDDENIVSVGGPNITPEDDTEFAKCVGAVLSFLSKPGARFSCK